MDSKRLKMHEDLMLLLESDNVYFQPPDNVRLKYPCIVYERRTGNTFHADDNPYIYKQVYDVTYISRDPDDGFVQKAMTTLQGIRYDRHFVSDNLHHDIFTVVNNY